MNYAGLETTAYLNHFFPHPDSIAPVMITMLPSFLIVSLAGVPLARAQACPLQFDGRVPADFALADFDAANDLFDSDSVFGEGMFWRADTIASVKCHGEHTNPDQTCPSASLSSSQKRKLHLYAHCLRTHLSHTLPNSPSSTSTPSPSS